MIHSTLDSPVGRLTIFATERGLKRITWSRQDATAFRRASGSATTGGKSAEAHLRDARRWLTDYFAGRKAGKAPPFDLGGLTPFQTRVLRTLARVARGRTLSYGELAERAGHPGAARAVGGAMAANPLPVIIPCHRVLAAGGKPGGFTGGLRKKRILLELEGVDFPFERTGKTA